MKHAHEFQVPAAKGWPRHRFLQVWVDDLTMDEVLDQLDAQGGMVFTLNPDHLYHQRRNAEFLAAYRSAQIITVDSKYVYRGLQWLGTPVRETVCGSDLVPAYLRRHRDNPEVRIFLLGAAPGVAAAAMERINAASNHKLVVDALSPSMQFVNSPDEIAAALERIRASGANALFVGLGAPKQEVWLARYRAELPGVRVFMGIGATIDYEAGHVKRAPESWRRLGLEWAYRVVTEPRRYLPRYVRNSSFIWHMLHSKFAGRPGRTVSSSSTDVLR